MPKEIIDSRYPKTGTPRTQDDPPYVGLGVHVGWGKYRPENADPDGHVEIACVEVHADHSTRAGGVMVQLSRGDLNRLIHSLRKARDQAFGADA